jgi:hypothetical protein
MGVYTNLKALTALAAEQSTVAAAVGYEDWTGMLQVIVNELAQLNQKLTRLQTYVPAGTNLTAIGTALTALS